MEPAPNGFSDSLNGIPFRDEIDIRGFDLTQDFADIFKSRDDPLDLSFMENTSFRPVPDTNHVIVSTSNSSLDVDSQVEDLDMFKFINQILMEENLEQKPSMFYDPLALQATEKSLYDVLGEKYPPSLDVPPFIFPGDMDSPDSNIFGSSSENSTSSNTTNSDSGWMVEPEHNHHHQVQNDDIFSFSFQAPALASSNFPFRSPNRLTGSSISDHLIPDLFSEGDSILQFRRGVEEASKFLPSYNHVAIDLDSYKLPLESNVGAPIKGENAEQNLFYSLKGGKSHERDDSHLEERSNKQSAIFIDNSEEAELSELFDKVLLYNDKLCCEDENGEKNEETKSSQQNGQHLGKKTRSRKHANNKKEVVDLNTLLLSCAQSVSVNDRKTAYEQLKQIRQHSSPSGDASQRLAHVFANGLEARLAGTGSEIYQVFKSKRISAVEKLKAYKVYLESCPFKKMSVLYANKMILDLVCKSSKKKLHIVDFGILYGFQWPILIQFLSMALEEAERPELRITGIEYPQSGFRPLELVEETGCRLEKYCERFGIRFKYHAIAQNWETIKIEDLQLREDEDLAVNTLFRFKNLLDETVVPDSPRDTVLKLIKDMNPDLFLQTDINGSYTSPFFFTRFKETLFHYSLLFDMFYVNIPPEELARSVFELEFFGREILNVIACEGVERVERPETYKQWHIRNTRHGFKIVPPNKELVKKLREKVLDGYHKDFIVDEDSHWLLQGWKGRIFCASSCWVPARKAQ